MRPANHRVIIVALMGLLLSSCASIGLDKKSTSEPLATLSKFVPKDGRIVDGFGWYARDLKLYESEFPEIPPYSAQLMFGLKGHQKRGVNTLKHHMERYPDKVIHFSFGFDSMEELIPKGEKDHILKDIGNLFLESNRPIYLRIGIEPNGFWNKYENPADFVAAYRYMVDFWDNMGVTNVAYIWNVHIMDKHLAYMEWYPGDNYVDWWSHEILGPASDPDWNHDSPSTLQTRAFCRDAVSRGLPVALAEVTAWHTGVAEGQVSWDKWFDGFFNHVNNPEYGLKAYWYMPLDWSTVKGSWTQNADGRPSANPVVKANWLAELKKPQYLHATQPLDLDVIGWPVESVAPADVENLKVNVTYEGVRLSWKNPGDKDLKGIKVLRQEGRPPKGPRDTEAIQIHNGPASTTIVLDTSAQHGREYYYGVYAYDPVRNYAPGIVKTAR
ncbi:hypothetical protein ACFL1X_06175 [Candidatus Hydrogenedentota bacterium]